MIRQRAKQILQEHLEENGLLRRPLAPHIWAELRQMAFLDADGEPRLDALRAFAEGTPVLLKYYRTSGKYYGSGEFTSMREIWHDMLADVRAMQAAGALPGLVKGAREFIVLISPGEPWCVSHLLMPPAEATP